MDASAVRPRSSAGGCKRSHLAASRFSPQLLPLWPERYCDRVLNRLPCLDTTSCTGHSAFETGGPATPARRRPRQSLCPGARTTITPTDEAPCDAPEAAKGQGCRLPARDGTSGFAPSMTAHRIGQSRVGHLRRNDSSAGPSNGCAHRDDDSIVAVATELSARRFPRPLASAPHLGRSRVEELDD